MTPIHYNNGKQYDLIDVALDYNLNFFRFNVLKYICRAGKKEDEIKDLEKAIDYLERELQHLRKEQEQWIEKQK
jgi:vacuolar-type H+-ATPase subunit I/STV1